MRLRPTSPARRCLPLSTWTRYDAAHHTTAAPALEHALTSNTQEVKLSTTNAERDLNDSLAEIYSIIITLDALEKAYLKDSITETDYTGTCSRLLKQYKSNLANETVARVFGDLDSFAKEWHVRLGSRVIPLLC